MGMPLREYYSVVRAAELLGCKVEDLFHWASIGAIKLFVSFEEGHGYVRFIGDGVKKENRNLDRFTEEQFESAQHLRDELFKEKHTIDKFSRVVSLMRYEDIDLDSLPREERFYPCSFSGLWALPQNAYGMTALYSFQPSLDDFWFSAESKMFVSFEMDEFLNFDVEDFCISKSDFVLIKKCNDGDEFPSYINGGKEKIEPSKNPDEAHSTKTINKRAQFIKSLLRIHYGNEVAESPRRFLEDDNSEISKDFKIINITPPSGKAVQDWVKGVDIPFSGDE
ncbi:hypothetical protein ACMYSO_18050 [Klebsiella sp. B345]|uniref:hypothetical protein n=1 Tax=Klebsiella sp. B345 TaxID=2755398 RepID=UPI003DA953E0